MRFPMSIIIPSPYPRRPAPAIVIRMMVSADDNTITMMLPASVLSLFLIRIIIISRIIMIMVSILMMMMVIMMMTVITMMIITMRILRLSMKSVVVSTSDGKT